MSDYTKYQEEGKRDNFTMMPNLIDDMELSPAAYRVYGHIRRRTGEIGECFETSKTIAEYCKLSRGTIARAKKELVRSGLITITKANKGHGEFASDVITIKDIWELNEIWFSHISKETRKDVVLEHKEYGRIALNNTVASGSFPEPKP
ncbi:MAG: helix-turn-helix domain-containing protein [Anaerolineales bacterium]|jgi:DNA-binding transcriptional regulator YhcF (GntR family)